LLLFVLACHDDLALVNCLIDALINSTTWLYGAEVVPLNIRGRMVGVSAVAHYCINVGVTEAGPTAFAKIHENYYYVFVATCTIYLFIIYFYFP